MARHRSRRVKNFLINRPLQLRIGSYFVTVSLVLAIIAVAYIVYNFSVIRGEISTIQGLPFSFQVELNSRMSEVLYVSVAFLLLTVITNFLYGIYISHRIAGPMYAIVKYIQRLREGHFDEQRNLRPTDELGPIMQELHELAKELKQKQK